MAKEPDAFRTISEVADDLAIPQHVLRFWETRFNQIKPMKRGGGRRYYRPADVELLRGIKQLLYGEGYTIKGVQKILRDQGPRYVQSLADPEAETVDVASEEAIEPETKAEPRKRLVMSPVMSEDAEPDQDSTEIDASSEPTPPEENTADVPATGDLGVSLGLKDEDIKTLRNVIFDLTECKRILDGARDTS
ncbi:MAG: MerR family transcriptional regulator [Pseudomonadota bacterium]